MSTWFLSAASHTDMSDEKLSKTRAIELWDLNLLDDQEPGSIETLCFIHHYLFQDVFSFAGQLRDVNIAKGNFRYASVLYLEPAIREVCSLPQSSVEEIIHKYVEMNVIHPFREGNGCAMRIWLDHMFKELSLCVDWAKIKKADYLSAMERSPVNTLEIEHLLARALTDEIHDRTVYMRGIQQSYAYEDQKAFDITELDSAEKN